MGGVVNAVKSVAQVAIAPITAPVKAVQSVVAGDNVLAAARNATLQTTAAMNPLAVTEAALGASPTGFGAVALGSTEAADRNRFLISSAAGAVGGYGIGALGGVSALGAGAGATAATGGGISAGGVAAAAAGAAPIVAGAEKMFSPKLDNAVASAAAANRSPASDTLPLSKNTLLIAGGVVLAVLLLKRGKI